MKVYTGNNDSASGLDYHVSVREVENGRPVAVSSLPWRLDLRNHSPTGLSWGYNGSGPAQLALAILADATGLDDFALSHYQQYKHEVISRLDSSWSIPHYEVMDWVNRQLKGDRS